MSHKYKLIYIKFLTNNLVSSCIGVLDKEDKDIMQIIFTADDQSPIDYITLEKSKIEIIELTELENKKFNIE